MNTTENSYPFIELNGQSFQWTADHISPEFLETLRQHSDTQADELIMILQQWAKFNDICEPDTLLLIQIYLRDAQSDVNFELVKNAVEELARVPDYVDWEQIQRGQQVFVKYLLPIDIILFYLTLIGGYCAKRINKVLTCTGYLSGNPKNVMKRLRETQKMVVDAMKPDSLIPGAAGWKSVTRIRFLHARVRQRITMMARADPTRYSIEEDGIPINQEDLNVTLCGFSYFVLYGLETIFGLQVSQQEKDDFIALWRLIGHYLGVDENVNACVSVDTARIWGESMASHLLSESDHAATVLSRAGLLGNQIKGNLVYKSLNTSIASAVSILGEGWEKRVLVASDGDQRFMLTGLTRAYHFAMFRLTVLFVSIKIWLGDLNTAIICFFISRPVFLKWKSEVILTLADRMLLSFDIGNTFDGSIASKVEKVEKEQLELHHFNAMFGKKLFVKERVAQVSTLEIVLIPFTLASTYIILIQFFFALLMLTLTLSRVTAFFTLDTQLA